MVRAVTQWCYLPSPSPGMGFRVRDTGHVPFPYVASVFPACQ